MQSSALTQIATYRRRVAASSERVWENVLDWEHLPFLHSASFRSIAVHDAGDWGWRARIGLHPSAEIELELRLSPGASRYVARTLEGPGARTEIWTTVTPQGPAATDIEVAFWLPDIQPEHAPAIGSVYTQLYQKLWDEDESMMVRRTRELARGQTRDRTQTRVALGLASEVRAKLPLCIEWQGQPFRIVAQHGEMLVHASICPHRLGPLDEGRIENGAVTCPWHGWRFDVRSGRAQGGRRARLAAPPRLETDADGKLWLSEARTE
jgi:nitrite reductase/ring-hydroxylating ferredoxin subunit